jgi:ribosomal protein S18 acetylase RimI-like enzyme
MAPHSPCLIAPPAPVSAHESIRETLGKPVEPKFRWIPIRSLAERHRPRILAHLLEMDAADRYLRFGYPASDTQISHYVDVIDFQRDEVFGVFNRRLQLVAMAHLAYLGDGAQARTSAEFGVSVLSSVRGRGYGARLFDHAMLHARNRGVDTMVIHALSENTAMLRIVRRAGATVARDGSESEARLKLPADNVASRLNAMVEDSAAEIDYGLKAHALRVDHLLGSINDASQRTGKAGTATSE